MNSQANDESITARLRSGERGISVLELVLVVAIIGIVSTFAYSRITAAQQAMRVTNSARNFTGFLQKARIDSIRRHAMTAATQGKAVISSGGTSYTISTDPDGNGTIDTVRQLQPGVTFSAFLVDNVTAAVLPVTITFDWRGKATAIDSNNAAVGSVGLTNQNDNGTSNSNRVTVSVWGDASISQGDSGQSSFSTTVTTTNPTVSSGTLAASDFNSSMSLP
jgi:Tfp pilus assembly protein FimT